MVWHSPYRKGDAADGQLWRSVILFLAECMDPRMGGKEVGKGALIQAGKPKRQDHLSKKKKKANQKIWDALIPDLYLASACSRNEGHDTPMWFWTISRFYYLPWAIMPILAQGWQRHKPAWARSHTGSLRVRPRIPSPQPCFLNHIASPAKPCSLLCAASNTAHGHAEQKFGHHQHTLRKSIWIIMISIRQSHSSKWTGLS